MQEKMNLKKTEARIKRYNEKVMTARNNKEKNIRDRYMIDLPESKKEM